MNCRTATDLLPEWSVGRVEPSSSMALQEHLNACENCRLESESYRVLVEEIDFVGQVPSSRMRQNMRDLLESRQQRVLPRRLSYLAIAVMGIGAIMIPLLSYDRSSEDDPMEVAAIATEELREIRAFSRDRNDDQWRAALAPDGNPAIRIVALDLLLQTSPPAELRKELERALLTEQSPIVRTAMASVLEEMER
ncbi:MAG: hypothetical protein KY432_11150 [Acidobacteria bacterium]|nr:hypothetical protein [Acidobacteriota bacterium]